MEMFLFFTACLAFVAGLVGVGMEQLRQLHLMGREKELAVQRLHSDP